MSLGRRLRRATAAGRDQLEIQRAAADGRIDAYRCPGDGVRAHVTITIQVDRGNPPKTIPCPQCGRDARSLGHPKVAARHRPTHELYMPKGPEAQAIYDARGEAAERLRRAELFVRPRRQPVGARS